MNKVFIIAEAGVNHNGRIELAKKLIDVAVEAKVDAVKFQTFISSKVITQNTEKAKYQIQMTDSQESQLDMIKKLELSFTEFYELKKYCDSKSIMFLSAPFDLESIDFLNQIDMKIFKIPSGEITNYPYLKKIGKLKKQVILSTGMSYLNEIKEAIKVLKENGTDHITVLHCNTEYPTPMKDANLSAMNIIKEKLNVEIGYSDHTKGIEVPIAAVAMGARVIEKHFTLDKNMHGPDHKASLEPNELREMVKAIRNIEKAIGSGLKIPSESEIKNLNIVRKSIVAKRFIKKGEKFTENNLTCKRPGNGLSPMKWEKVLKSVAIKDFKEDEMIEL